MTNKLALKRLTASDLTFFRYHFVEHPAGKQKAINLNADVFVEAFYPALPTIMEEREGTLPIDLYIYGPGVSSELNLQRKIQKGETYKNFRLNGEFVHDPEEERERFHVLSPGDYALFEFTGEIEPRRIRLVLIAAGAAADASLHQSLSRAIPQGSPQSMVPLSSSQLASLVEAASVSEDHPVYLLLIDEALEDAALGGLEGMQRLESRAARGTITDQALAAAREAAHRNGRRGEELVNEYLAREEAAGRIAGFVWTSRDNAVSAYDFAITENDGSTVLLDVKTTGGSFENAIHVSMNELLHMAAVSAYHIYRVYQLDEKRPQLRITTETKDLAASILAVLETLPGGVVADGVSINPNQLDFGEEQRLSSMTMLVQDRLLE